MSNVNQRVPASQQEEPKLLTELQSEVSVEAAPLLQFIVRHMGAIVMVLVLFIVALAGTAGYNWYTERSRVAAQKELSKVVMTAQGADKVKALQAFVGSAPATVKTAALLALADAAMNQQDYAQAAQAFGQIAAADPQGALGLLAGLNQAQALLRAEKPKEALPLLEKLEGLMPEAQRNVVRQVLAEAALQAGDKARAVTAFEAMAKATGGTEAEFYLFRAQALAAGAESK